MRAAKRHSQRSADIAQSADGLPLVETRASRSWSLGVFWHTQGSGKSYSMAFFAEKVRRAVREFHLCLMTDREDLDEPDLQDLVGCGVADETDAARRAGKELKALLRENHRYVFSLIHKFNQDVNPDEPYSSGRHHRHLGRGAPHPGGQLARNMRMALPNAAFIGFTGTPLFKHDHLTSAFRRVCFALRLPARRGR